MLPALGASMCKLHAYFHNSKRSLTSARSRARRACFAAFFAPSQCELGVPLARRKMRVGGASHAARDPTLCPQYDPGGAIDSAVSRCASIGIRPCFFVSA
jgi:hypothetical protein